MGLIQSHNFAGYVVGEKNDQIMIGNRFYSDR
jgi:hypothetical protein